MEDISRDPTLGDFFTILTKGSMQDNMVARLQTTEYKSADFSFSPLLNVMHCVRVSLRTVKIFLAQH
jgi:hypothetical protein